MAPRRRAFHTWVAELAAPLSGPVLYYLIRAVYGGPRPPSHEAGDAAIAIAVA